MEGISGDLKKLSLVHTDTGSKEQWNIDGWIHFCPFSPIAFRLLVVFIKVVTYLNGGAAYISIHARWRCGLRRVVRSLKRY